MKCRDVSTLYRGGRLYLKIRLGVSMYTARKQRKLDPDSTEQMDAFNEEYMEACKKLNISRETMDVIPQRIPVEKSEGAFEI